MHCPESGGKRGSLNFWAQQCRTRQLPGGGCNATKCKAGTPHRPEMIEEKKPVKPLQPAPVKEKPKAEPKLCKVRGCDREHNAMGLRTRDYKRMQKNKAAGRAGKCIMPDCQNEAVIDYLCLTCLPCEEDGIEPQKREAVDLGPLPLKVKNGGKTVKEWDLPQGKPTQQEATSGGIEESTQNLRQNDAEGCDREDSSDGVGLSPGRTREEGRLHAAAASPERESQVEQLPEAIGSLNLTARDGWRLIQGAAEDAMSEPDNPAHITRARQILALIDHMIQ